VFRRTGEPCPRCGTGIKRLIIGQRSTHICPSCQRQY
jgi:formamidopyrimidine-DNA glycosylase